VNLLDNTFRPIPGFTAMLKKGGFRAPVEWENKRKADASLGEIRNKSPAETPLAIARTSLRRDPSSRFSTMEFPLRLSPRLVTEHRNR